MIKDIKNNLTPKSWDNLPPLSSPSQLGVTLGDDKMTKYYTVKVRIPEYITKEIYIDDATSITDAKRKAKAWGRREYDAFDFSGDEHEGQEPWNLKIVSVEEEGDV